MATFLERLSHSSILLKVLMAVSGLGIIGFLIAHVSGNLLMFSGPEKINAYAQGLRDLGPLLWVARIGVLACLIAHVWSAIMLGKRNRMARPIGYKMKKPLKSTIFSRTMMLSGLTIFLFAVFHLMHYTFGKVQPEYFNGEYTLHGGRIVHDVYSMVVYGFQNPIYTVTYIFCMTLLGFHLSHAVTSVFQTFGLNNIKYAKFLKLVGPIFATIIVIAYLSIPISVALGIIEHRNQSKNTANISNDITYKEIKR